MCSTASATFAASITGSGRIEPSACGAPCVATADIISVAALPASIWPQAML